MSENGEWRLQASFKFGNHLVNVRAVDWGEFMNLVNGVPSNAPEILVAGASLEKPPAPPRAGGTFMPDLHGVTSSPAREPGEDFDENPAPAPAPALKGQEIGPGMLKGEAIPYVAKTGPRAGQSGMRYVATLGGIKASTFDSLEGSVVLQLNGKQAYMRVEKKDQFYNLLGVRPA